MTVVLLPVSILLGAHYQAAVTLKFKPPVGATYRYAMTGDMNMVMSGGPKGAGGAGLGGPMKMGFSSDISMKVLDRKNGISTIESKTGAPKFTAPEGSPFAAMMKQGMDKAGNKGQTGRAEVDEQFHLRSGSFGGGKAMGGDNSQMFQYLYYPSHPLHVGDTWQSKLDLGKMMAGMGGAAGSAMGGMKIRGVFPLQFKLTGIDHVGGTTIARIALSADGTMTVNVSGTDMPMKMKIEGHYQVDAGSGMTRACDFSSSTNGNIMGIKTLQKTNYKLTPK